MSFFFRCALSVSFLGLRQHWRYDAFGADDERRSLGRGKPEFRRVKTIHFEIVPYGLRTGSSEIAFLTHVSLTSTPGQFGEFLVTVELLSADALRPFKRCQRIVGPYSLQVRFTVGCARRCPSLSDCRNG